MKSYYVDFECFEVQARNEDEAQKKVEAMLKKGNYPKITNIEKSN